MLYNFDWLQSGKLFPPLAEIPRLKGYKDNADLFDDNIALVLKPYYDRLGEIISGLKEKNYVNDSFFNIPNYWQLSTIKTGDLMVGDEPNIKCEKKQDDIDEALIYTEFFSKLNELVYDNDSLGECIVRPYIDKSGRRTFVSNNPSMWFPIVNPENVKEVLTDVLAWTVCTFQDANEPSRNKYELCVKIQNRGETSIEYRRYKIDKHFYKSYIYQPTQENCGTCHFFTIGKLLEQRVEEAPYTQLVIQIPGVTTSRSLHGISNYERITAIVAEIAIRESLANFILDQNSAPRMGAPESAFVKNKDGRWVLKTGGRNFVVAPNEQPPVYITWDGNLTSNENRIAELKKELFAMCEMGTIINHDDINSSQGHEALEVKMTNPKLKVRRMAGKFKTPLKRLIAYLINDDSIADKDISIIFNDGIPVSENQNLDMAQKKKNLGVSTQSVLIEYFGLTEEQAQAEVEKARQESADAFAEQFGATRNSLFGGGKDGGNAPNKDETDEDEENIDDEEKDDKNNKNKDE